MAIDPDHLHRAVADWPLLVSGPIVRRVTRSSAAVFLAATEPFEGTLTVYDGTDELRQAVPQTGGRATSRTLGRRLHVTVLESTGLTLAPGRVYGYDLLLETDAGSHDLTSLGLLTGPVPLGYVEGALPGFVVPGSLDTLRIAHGSCRKPHGCVAATLSDPDVLPLVDRLIEQDRGDGATRLQQLLLAGDQIYADDVPAALLAALTSAGRSLLDWGTPEVFPDRRGIETFTDDHIGLEPGDRSGFLDDQGVKDRPPYADPAAWSDYAANHLLFLSEWYAMYLFAWSPELWQRRDVVDPDDRDAHPTRSYYYLPDAADAWSASPDTTTPALVYAQGLPWVRRALANVATYMVFDDHDVTDDWFLNAKVDEQLRGQGEVAHTGGRRLMRNALAAYAVFQHWGNDPDAFAAGTPGEQLLDLLDADNAEATPLIGRAGHEHDADVLLDVGAATVGPDRRDERLRWDYELLFDEHRLLVLDCRTWRGYPTGPVDVDVDELLEAAADRADEITEWGADTLRAMGAAWSDAADRAAGQVTVFLRSGVVLLEQAADLADDLASAAPGWGVHAELLLQEQALWLAHVADAATARGESWAADVLADAEAAVFGADLDDTLPAVEGAMALGAVLNEASFRVRSGVEHHLRETGLGALSAEALDLRRVLEATADWCRHLASHVEGAAVSVGRASRFAAAAARVWVTLASTEAAVLWGQLGDDTAAALSDASVTTADLLGTLEELHHEHKESIDPVWTLLVGDGAKKLNAELISDAALDFQVRERVAAADRRRELTLVVSPGPVVGHWLAEFAQRAQVLKVELGGGAGDETWDNEPWSGNMAAFTRFLDSLVDLGSVVFLSGDVHYAFSSVTDYVARDGRTARFVQLTSSATKNADDKTHAFGKLDEVVDDLTGMAMGQFDFVELLPTAEEWAQLPSDIAETIPSVDDAVAKVSALATGIREDLGDLAVEGSWDYGLWWVPDFRRAVEHEARDTWYELNLSWLQHKEQVLEQVGELWEDPVRALVGDRLASHPLVQEQLLLLLDQLGVDVEELPELHTTVLRDRRADERAEDSPGIGARLDGLFATNRNVRLRLDRVTVGHDNMGLISTQRTPVGRYVTHDLHWHPFDAPVDEMPVDPEDDESWRDDWIITRHVAGLVPPTPPDGGAIGVPPPTEAVVDLVTIDVTSPGQVQQGQRRVHVIDHVAPTMPSVSVVVRLAGVTDAEDAALPRRVRLVVSYVDGARDDVVRVPGPGDDDWLTLQPGQDTWTPVFPRVCGGELTVHAEVDHAGGTATAVTPADAHVVWGTNAPKPDVHAEIGTDTNRLVVFHRESRFTQFATDPAGIGSPVLGPHTVLCSFDHGYGLGQLTTSPVPEPVELWDWRANVASSLARLDGFRDDALAYVEQVRTGAPWDDATGRGPPWPPDEGVARPEAPDLTTDQLDLEMWARYNSGRRYHDYAPATQSWVRQPLDNPALTEYAPQLLTMRQQVDAGDHPRGWFT